MQLPGSRPIAGTESCLNPQQRRPVCRTSVGRSTPATRAGHIFQEPGRSAATPSASWRRCGYSARMRPARVITSIYKHTFQATPILVGSTLYFSTAFNRVFAVDAQTGVQSWRYDAGIDPEPHYTEVSNRGVVHWVDHNASAGQLCQERIFVGTLDSRLIALDAANGKRCAGFAENGEVDLKAALREQDRGRAYPVTSPPVVIGDMVVLGSGMIDNWKAHLGLGTVWAYDARSGELRWKWHAIPRDPAADNAADWLPEQAARTGTANVWSPLSVDPERGLVFAATGSASPDYFGGERLGNNRHANSLVALDAIDRRGGLVLPDRPPRPVGLRSSRTADAGRDRARRGARAGGDPADQDGHAVHLSPRHRRAVLRDRRAAGAALGRPGRAGLADTAVPGRATAADPASRDDRGRRLGPDPDRPRRVPGPDRIAAGARASTRHPACRARS